MSSPDHYPQRTKYYRDKVNGKFMGVCAGIADYTGIDVLWVRIAFLVLAFSMGWPFLIYFAFGFLADKKPARLYADQAEQKFWQGVRQSPARTAREVRSSFRDIDRRLAEVEQFYVSGNPRLSAEIEKLR
ncbi:MAG: envelope stress response membrane protein PspC [Novosphingobium sp.]